MLIVCHSSLVKEKNRKWRKDELNRKKHGKNSERCWKYVSSLKACLNLFTYNFLIFYLNLIPCRSQQNWLRLWDGGWSSTIYVPFPFSLLLLWVICFLCDLCLLMKILMNSKAESIFEDDERFQAVERDRDRRDLFESYLEELKNKVWICMVPTSTFLFLPCLYFDG